MRVETDTKLNSAKRALEFAQAADRTAYGSDE